MFPTSPSCQGVLGGRKVPPELSFSPEFPTPPSAPAHLGLGLLQEGGRGAQPPPHPEALGTQEALGVRGRGVRGQKVPSGGAPHPQNDHPQASLNLPPQTDTPQTESTRPWPYTLPQSDTPDPARPFPDLTDPSPGSGPLRDKVRPRLTTPGSPNPIPHPAAISPLIPSPQPPSPSPFSPHRPQSRPPSPPPPSFPH